MQDLPVTAPAPPPMPVVRATVRDLLLSSPAYRELDPESRRRMAESMVRVCHTAVSLVKEELESDTDARSDARADEEHTRTQPTLAIAQSAASDYGGTAADRIAGTTQAVLNAVSFPRFVTDLINGVFKAMIDSSTQQMHSYVELLNNVAASTDGFADANMGADRARAWLIDKFPGVFEMSGERDPNAGPGEQDDIQLQLKDGASMPSQDALRTALGMEPDESVPGGDPETLVPFARRQISKQRQQMLSTMVMLGMQRIVVDSGRISAAMRFHIDTRSAAQADEAKKFTEQNQIEAQGSFGFGPWGASAKMTNNIGYVSTSKSQTTEEMNTDLDLSSSVEINFKSDYLPLNRLTTPGQASRIVSNSLNPDAEKAAIDARTTRAARNAASDDARRQSLDRAIGPETPAAAPNKTPTAGAPAAGSAAPQPASGGGKTAAGSPNPAGQTSTTGAPPATPATAAPAPGANAVNPLK